MATTTHGDGAERARTGAACARARTHTFCVAPMMERTDRHERYLLRLISRHARLYTEMVTTGALLHGDAARHLDHDASEHPLALQIGGSDPVAAAACARLAARWGYDEVNLNVGCPSDRVRAGSFGACLMAAPGVVAACVAAMRGAADLPVTVKTRIGIAGRDGVRFPFARLLEFVDTVHAAGCDTFIVHAREAWLEGLSPRENRAVPPLRHDVVERLKRARPALAVVVNGGVRSLAQAGRHLAWADGVMMGREAYANPWVLADVDRRLYGAVHAPPGRAAVARAYAAYAEREIARGARAGHLARHLMGLYAGLPGARAWRRTLGEGARDPRAGAGLIHAALERVERRREAACGASA